jgi:hypothetical protein
MRLVELPQDSCYKISAVLKIIRFPHDYAQHFQVRYIRDFILYEITVLDVCVDMSASLKMDVAAEEVENELQILRRVAKFHNFDCLLYVLETHLNVK